MTNFNDGVVSSFTRNTTTGALTLTSQVTTDATGGPRGVIAVGANLLYVADINDDNIYEYLIGTKGALSHLAIGPAFVSNGSGSGPDELATSPGVSPALVWVTGAHNGTVTSYVVSSSTGQLTSNGSIGGFDTPFGIKLHPTLQVLYVSDTTTGLIQPMSYNFDTGALSKAGFTAVHSSDINANTPAAIAIDPEGDSLFIADQVLGEVSSFSIDNTGAICGQAGCLTPEFTFQNSSTSDVPVGVGIAVNTSIEFLFTANQGGGSVSSFVATGTTVNVPPTVAAGYKGPTGLVVDPQNAFVYTADKFDGTVSQSTINGSCGSQLCAGPLVSTESPANVNSAPFGITLAQ